MPTMSDLLTIAEGAAHLRLSIFTVRSWIFQKRIPFVRLGRRVLLRREDLEKLVNDGLVEARERD
jgi:excisionase family DNA binding protein